MSIHIRPAGICLPARVLPSVFDRQCFFMRFCAFTPGNSAPVRRQSHIYVTSSIQGEGFMKIALFGRSNISLRFRLVDMVALRLFRHCGLSSIRGFPRDYPAIPLAPFAAPRPLAGCPASRRHQRRARDPGRARARAAAGLDRHRRVLGLLRRSWRALAPARRLDAGAGPDRGVVLLPGQRQRRSSVAVVALDLRLLHLRRPAARAWAGGRHCRHPAVGRLRGGG
ncbi:Uncharacterised protein [Achromobacter xylosoxidans]|nr:Uncharacterised protein [Achromobacter xylosoxidans]